MCPSAESRRAASGQQRDLRALRSLARFVRVGPSQVESYERHAVDQSDGGPLDRRERLHFPSLTRHVGDRSTSWGGAEKEALVICRPSCVNLLMTLRCRK